MLINSISNTYKGMREFHEEMVKDMSFEKKSQELEGILTELCDRIAYINVLTDKKNVDIELLLQIVAAYLIGKEQGELPEDTPPPSKLFEESLFPALEKAPIEVEVIKEEVDDDSGTDTGALEDVGSEQNSD